MQKVSIIVPIYNSENKIWKCVDSLINQTYSNIEIILINDGSTDDTLNKIHKYKKDNRIIIIDKKNEGVAKTRNLGINLATGSYVMFVDNDDFLEYNYVKKYIENIKDNDILIGGYERVTDSKVIYKQKVFQTEWMKYIVMAPWAKLYKKQFILENNGEFLDYKIGEDVYFNLLLLSKNPKISYIDYQGYKWFFNEKSISNTSQKGLNVDIIYLLEKLKGLDVNLDQYFNYYLKRYSVWFLLFSGKNSSKSEFLEYNNKINQWMKKNSLNKTISPFSLKIRGESFKNRIVVCVFTLLNRCCLMSLFAKFYCKSKEV